MAGELGGASSDAALAWLEVSADRTLQALRRQEPFQFELSTETETWTWSIHPVTCLPMADACRPEGHAVDCLPSLF